MLAPSPNRSPMPPRRAAGALPIERLLRALRDGPHRDKRSSHAARAIERRSDIGAREFRRDYLLPRRPVVVTDALRDWPALKMFTPEFFRQNFADMRVQIRGRACRLGGRDREDPCR